MTTITSVKRYSREDAQAIMARLKQYSFDDLHRLFKEGKAPSFEEIEGETAGSVLALSPKIPRWKRLLGRILFDDTPLFRWTGKSFDTPFGEKQIGKGVNLYRSRIMPHRFPFQTSIKRALLDQDLCLALDYSLFAAPLSGTRDELRRTDDGVFLGQAHYKPPGGKRYSLQGYFVLCALKKQNGGN